jgi:hypothetical protein
MTTTNTTHPMIRSRSMLLLQEDLARARIHQRLAEAEAVRQIRIARARRDRRDRTRVAAATARARLLVGLVSAR